MVPSSERGCPPGGENLWCFVVCSLSCVSLSLPLTDIPIEARRQKFQGVASRGDLVRMVGLAAFLALAALLVLWGPQGRDPRDLSWEGYDTCRCPQSGWVLRMSHLTVRWISYGRTLTSLSPSCFSLLAPFCLGVSGRFFPGCWFPPPVLATARGQC